MNDDKQFGKVLEGHDYDGIRELDNPTPRWWMNVFYASIVFGVGYLLYFHVFGGPSQKEELAQEMAKWESVQKENAAKVDPAELERMVANPADVQKGAAVFTSKCASCHGDAAQGLIGPNLTDDAWIHGSGTTPEIFALVRDGVAEKGMPPWGPVLTPRELMEVVAYVRTRRGTHPPNPKAPQGEVVK